MEICKLLFFFSPKSASRASIPAKVALLMFPVVLYKYKILKLHFLRLYQYKAIALGVSVQKLGHHQFAHGALDLKSTKPLLSHLCSQIGRV